jgi:8-oxo-dGTP diphosphatase
MSSEPHKPRDIPPFAVTVDIAIFTLVHDDLGAVLIRRGAPPFLGALALPGGFVKPDEDLLEAAVRELEEETALTIDPADLVQVGAYGAPGRDPRQRVVSVAFAALVANLDKPAGGSDAASAAVYPVHEVLARNARALEQPNREHLLAFDHAHILDDALKVVTQLIERTPLATHFCTPTFTLGELRQVYEAVWNEKLDAANFRKRVLKADDFLVPTGTKRLPKGDRGRLAETYTRGSATEISPPLRKPGTYFHEPRKV